MYLITTDDSFKALPQFCQELEKLTLGRDLSSLQIPYFPKLKRFTVFNDSYNHRNLYFILGGFGHLYTKQLDGLQFFGQNPELFKKDALINQFRAIKKFKIEYS